MKTLTFIILVLFSTVIFAESVPAKSADDGLTISIRTENYPRPPYSGATYFLYEREGKTICTKLEVCNKFDECQVRYWRGQHKEPEDVQTGAPYGATSAVRIRKAKLKKHVCLVKFMLLQ